MKVRRLLQGNQRGFTLVEMLVVVALIGIIAAGIAMTISQVVAVNSRTSSHMVALRQVQQAGDRVSKDVLQAQPPPVFGSEPGSFFTLIIPQSEVDPNTKEVYHFWHEIEYTLEDMSGGLKRLERTRREYDRDQVFQSAVTTIVAQYILMTHPETGEEMTSFEPAEEDGAWVFKVTARVGMRTETREYEIKPRPGS